MGQRIQVVLEEALNPEPPHAHSFAPVAAPLEVPEIHQLDRPISPVEQLAFHSGLVTGVMRGVIDPGEVVGHHYTTTELLSGRVSPEQTIHHFQLLEGAVSGRVPPDLVVANFQADAGIVMGGGQGLHNLLRDCLDGGQGPPGHLGDGRGPPELLDGGQGPPGYLDGGRGPPDHLHDGQEPPELLHGGRGPPELLGGGRGPPTQSSAQEGGDGRERPELHGGGGDAEAKTIPTAQSIIENEERAAMEHFARWTCGFIALPIAMLCKAMVLQKWHAIPYAVILAVFFSCGLFQLSTFSGYAAIHQILRVAHAWLIGTALMSLLDDDSQLITVDNTTQFLGIPIEMFQYNDFITFSYPVGSGYMAMTLIHWALFGYLLKLPHAHMWKGGLVFAIFKIGILTYVSVRSPDPRVFAGMIQCGLATALSWYVIEYVLHGKLCATRDEQLRRKISSQTGCALDVSECALGKNPFSKTWINRNPCFIFWKTATERHASEQPTQGSVQEGGDGRERPELHGGGGDAEVKTIPTVQSIIENEERAVIERFGYMSCYFIALPIAILCNAMMLRKWHFCPHAGYFIVALSCGLFQLLTYSGHIILNIIWYIVRTYAAKTSFMSLLDNDHEFLNTTTQSLLGAPIEMFHYNDFIQFSCPAGIGHICMNVIQWLFSGYLLKLPHTHMWKQGLVFAISKIGILTYVYVHTSEPRVAAGIIQYGLAIALTWYVIDYVLYGKLCATRDEQLRRKISNQTGRVLDVSECALGKNPFSKTWINRPCFIFWKTRVGVHIYERYSTVFSQEEGHEYPPCVHTALTSASGGGDAKENFDLIDKVQQNRRDRLKYALILYAASFVLLWRMGYTVCLLPSFISFSITSVMFWRQGTKRYPSVSEEAMNAYRSKYRESCESSRTAFYEADCAAHFLRDNAVMSRNLLQLERQTVKRLNEVSMFLFILGMYLWIIGYPHHGMAYICIFGFALSGQFNYTKWSSSFWGLSHTVIMSYFMYSDRHCSYIAITFIVPTASIFASHCCSLNKILDSSSHSEPSYQNTYAIYKQLLMFIGLLWVSSHVSSATLSEEWNDDDAQSNNVFIVYIAYIALVVCIFVIIGYAAHRTNGVPQRGARQWDNSTSELSTSGLDMSGPLRPLRDDVLKIIRQERWKGVKRFQKASWFLIWIPLAILYSQDFLPEQLSIWVYLSLGYCAICFTGVMKVVTLSGYIHMYGMTMLGISLVFRYCWSEVIHNPGTLQQFLSIIDTPYRLPIVNYEIVMVRVQGVRSFTFPVGAPHMLDTVIRFYLFGYLIRLPTLHFCAAECGLCFIKLYIGREMFDATDHLVIQNAMKQTSLLGVMTTATIVGLYCAMATSDNARIVKKVRAKTGRYVDASDIDHMLPNNWIKWNRIPFSQFVQQWLESYRARRLRNSLRMREDVKRCIRRKQQKVIDDFWINSLMIILCVPQVLVFVSLRRVSFSQVFKGLLSMQFIFLGIGGIFQVLTYSGYAILFWYHTVVKCAGFSVGMLLPATRIEHASQMFLLFCEYAGVDIVLHFCIFGYLLHMPRRHFQIHGASFTVYKWIAVIVLLQDERVHTVPLITFSVLTTIVDIVILLCYNAFSKKRDEELSAKIKRRLHLPLPINVSISDVMPARWVSWDYVNTLWGRIRAWWGNGNALGHVHTD